MTRCAWGVVVLSPHFFSKPWPNYELNGLVARAMAEGKQMILPIWHNVTHADVIGFSPSLADLFALRSPELTVSEIAAEIIEAVSA